MEPTFFATPDELRAWFDANHAEAAELLVGFGKAGSGIATVTWSEAVDEALCVGWIDGVRKRVDDASYSVRFTPRKARSTWSTVNIAKVAELIAEGRMRPEGLAAFERRTLDNSEIYSHEQTEVAFVQEQEAVLRSDQRGWEFWTAQAPSYRKQVTWWVISAKKPETRERRLAQLVECNAAGERMGQFSRAKT
ncbi:YdeI/OmpD-associated family protein [Actinokineospora pegani]|uniref:YdeI/OmpD-associated family protein n=1 Tax=Actinokineospora pegani TaxID=2654637 RepID=UPI0012EAD1F5|nr:YdeI/OmpD-associated family protein [Actinokineospora pegani]